MKLTTLPGHTLTTTPRHDDGTLCGHQLTTWGRALEAGCSGRHDYAATCSCGIQWNGKVLTSLGYHHAQHLRTLADRERRAVR